MDNQVKTTSINNALGGMSLAKHERLAKLLEELGEVQQVIGKILRFGYDSYHPDTPAITNKMRLEEELGHVSAIVDMMMIVKGDISGDQIVMHRMQHIKKMKKYMRYQEG